MKIKMITLYAGPGGVMEAGKPYEVNDALGKVLVAGKFAVTVEEPVVPVTITPDPSPEGRGEPVETSQLTVDAMEKAVKPQSRKS